MTVSSENRKAGPFTGNGVTDTFPFVFKVFADTDVVVYVADDDGVQSVFELDVDYTVALNEMQDDDPGGDVVTTVALPSGHVMVITSAVPQTNETEITSAGGFYPGVLNPAFDKLTMLVQQIKEESDRSLKVKITDPTDPDDLMADLLAAQAATAASASAASASASAAASSASSASTSATAAAASAAAAAASAAEAGPVSSIAGADGAVGLAVVSEGGSVTTDGNDISINIKHKPRGMLIIAHRGYADLGPQNTMSAFTAAAASGATVLELDVQVTSDGQLVVFHDDDMTALTGGALTGTVASHTWAEMQNVDVGTHYSATYASSRIPLFSEFLAFAKKAGVQFWPEVKNYRTSADIALMVNAVVDAGLEHLCVMGSFLLSDVIAIRAISKRIGVCHALNAADYSADGATLAALGGDVWRATSTSRVTAIPSHVDTLHDLGIKVAVYTPTRSLYVQDVQDLGVDAVYVDRFLPGGV